MTTNYVTGLIVLENAQSLRDGTQYSNTSPAILRATLEAIEQQNRRPDACFAVCIGKTTDALMGILAQAEDDGVLDGVVVLPRGASWDEGARAVVADHPKTMRKTESSRSWFWWLHDDTVPQHDALERQIFAADQSSSVGIVGCKQLGQDGAMLDVGFSTTRMGRRITGAELGEIDQGQLDHRSDVYAVSTGGMLVDVEIWRELGGFAPHMPRIGADSDFCWRAHRAGHRVVVVPGAEIVHILTCESSRTLFRVEREAAMRHVLTHRSFPFALAYALLLPFITILRFLVRVVTHQARRAGAEVTAFVGIVGHLGNVMAERASIRRIAKVPRRQLNGLLATTKDVLRLLRDRVEGDADYTETIEDPRTRFGVGGTTDSVDASEVSKRGFMLLGILVVIFGCVWIGLKQLIGTGPIIGGALAGMPVDASSLYQTVTRNWVYGGLGSGDPNDPLWAIIGLAAWPFGGDMSRAADVLVYGSLPLAAVFAWFAAGLATRSRLIRLWAAGVWAVNPITLTSLGQGRLAPLVAHVFLPLVVIGMARARGRVRKADKGSIGAAAGAGLALVVVACGAPILLPLVAIATVIVAVFSPGRRWRYLWVLVPSAAILFPQVVRWRSDWRAAFAISGQPLPFDQANGLQLLAMWPVLPPQLEIFSWLPNVLAYNAPAILGAPLIVVAAIGLFRIGPSGALARVGWATALIGMVGAVFTPYVVVAATAETTVRAWPGAALSVAMSGFLCAAIAAVDAWRVPRGIARSRAPRFVSISLVALMLLAPVATMATWTISAGSEARGAVLLARNGGVVLPAVAEDQAENGFRARTLVLSTNADSSTSVELYRHGYRQVQETSMATEASFFVGSLGQPGLRASDPAELYLQSTAAQLAGGADTAPNRGLVMMGVGYVFVPHQSVNDAQLRINLDASTALTRVSEDENGTLWRVSANGDSGGSSARLLPYDVASSTAALGTNEAERAQASVLLNDVTPANVVPLNSSVSGLDAAVPAGAGQRVLVLAERSAAGWKATLNGQPLRSVTVDGWAQGFEVPATGGQVEVSYDRIGAWIVPVVQGLVVVMTLFASLPWRKPTNDSNFHRLVNSGPLLDGDDPLARPSSEAKALPEAVVQVLAEAAASQETRAQAGADTASEVHGDIVTAEDADDEALEAFERTGASTATLMISDLDDYAAQLGEPPVSQGESPSQTTAPETPAGEGKDTK
ncbi:glycosyltransferase family 2 protein [Micrococcales bacterium 31B]|nr:glycosyltransferase family 2 protein [Micrococcales bacterium 31B]